MMTFTPTKLQNEFLTVLRKRDKALFYAYMYHNKMTANEKDTLSVCSRIARHNIGE